MRFNFSSTTIVFSFLVAFSYAQPQFLRRGGGGKFQDVLATTRTDGVLYQNDVEITTPNEVLDQGDIHDHQKDIVNGLKNQIIEKATRTFSKAEQSKDPTPPWLRLARDLKDSRMELQTLFLAVEAILVPM